MTEQIIINAENAVLGRLASYTAKQALFGKEVIIVNSNLVIVQGRKGGILDGFRKKRARGGSGLKGPLYPSQPEKILKRTIRDMLPYKQARGREALKRVRCYNSIPKELEDKKMIKSGKGRKGISLEYISRMIGRVE